ncbi:MAG: carboxymuconolactone decarboxylase family protein, partial [Thermoproteota archaeon]|nr:carboxymuconolactone decarboxylase family protein [Thermoproteota archaeon]
MNSFLPPIENPQDPIMKMAYDMTRLQFGKVLTPLKVVYARMPPEFVQFSTEIAMLDQKLLLPQETALLIRQRVAGINVCS